MKFGTSDYWNRRWGDKRKITIEMKGNSDDIDRLMAFLKHWKRCGGVGHTASVNFCMDGDGASHPKFRVDNADIEQYIQRFMTIDSKNEFVEVDGWDEISA